MPPRKNGSSKGGGNDSTTRGSSKSSASGRKAQAEPEPDVFDPNAAILEILNESQARIAAALKQRQDEVLWGLEQCDFAMNNPRKRKR
jgi:hypothetical protein